MNFNDQLDAIGALCPIPVLKAQKRLKNLQSGEILNVLADDPAATIDSVSYTHLTLPTSDLV